jgi:uncharacterized membrane protein HdeD (DUF308 family)
METNEGTIDRVVRLILGIVLLAGGLYLACFATTTIVWGWLAALIGVILLVTGAIGFCPIYALLKISTAPKKGAGKKAPAK